MRLQPGHQRLRVALLLGGRLLLFLPLDFLPESDPTENMEGTGRRDCWEPTARDRAMKMQPALGDASMNEPADRDPAAAWPYPKCPHGVCIADSLL